MSPRTNQQFSQMRETTKEKIERSSIFLFSRYGLSVTITQIAKHAGISQGLLYQHFVSKDALIAALVEKALNGSSLAIGSIFNAESSAIEKVEQISQMMMGMLQEPEHQGTQLFLFMIQVGMSNPQQEIVKTLSTNANKPILYLSQIIEQGQREGSVKDGNSFSLAIVYWAAVQGLCCYCLTGMPIPYEPKILSKILLK